MPMMTGCSYLGYTGTATALAIERSRPKREHSERARRGKSSAIPQPLATDRTTGRPATIAPGRLASETARSVPNVRPYRVPSLLTMNPMPRRAAQCIVRQ